MRNIRYLMIGIVGSILASSFCRGGGMDRFVDGEPIVTQELDKVVGAEIREAEDPLRDGTKNIGDDIGDADSEKIYYEEIDTTQDAWKKTTDYIKGLMNYALGIAGLVALIYLLYHGFMAVTAGGDEDKLKKGMQGVRYALIAIIGIAVAWFFISMIFRLITLLTK